MIRRPTPNELAPFIALDADGFATWLWVGLNTYLFEAAERSAFPGAEPFIHQVEGTIASDVGDFLGALPAVSRSNAQRALAMLLQQCSFSDPRDAELAQILLQIALMLKVPGIPRIITHKAPSIPDNDFGRRLITTAFDIAVSSGFVEAHDTVESISVLASLPAFPPQWTGRALIGMTRAAPDRFRQHYDALKQPLKRIFGSLDPFDPSDADPISDRNTMILQVARLVRDDAALAYPCQPGAGRSPEIHNWWLSALSDPELEPVFKRVQHGAGQPPNRRKPLYSGNDQGLLFGSTVTGSDQDYILDLIDDGEGGGFDA